MKIELAETEQLQNQLSKIGECLDKFVKFDHPDAFQTKQQWLKELDIPLPIVGIGIEKVTKELVDSVIPNGSPVGNLTSVEVDQNGLVTAIYDVGNPRTIYQIPLVDVPNPNGLISLDNQAYQVSVDSGSFFLWDAGDGPTGAVNGFTREESATDVAAELTALIQTQRAYSSNAKIIQTVDEMLQETTNIKR